VSAGELGELLPHIDLKVLDEGPSQSLPYLQTPFGAPAIDGALDRAALFDLWDKELPRLSGKSKLAEAIRYATSRRTALERYDIVKTA
jgi:hypothetical protein